MVFLAWVYDLYPALWVDNAPVRDLRANCRIVRTGGRSCVIVIGSILCMEAVMITQFCGECGEECKPVVDYDRKGRPVDVRSDCCGDDIFRDPELMHRLTAIDFDNDFNPMYIK